MSIEYQVTDEYCIGASCKHLEYLGGSNVVSICGNHLHVFDVKSKCSNVEKITFEPEESFNLTSLLHDKGGYLLLTCITRNHQTFMFECNANNNFALGAHRVELNGRAIASCISNDGKQIAMLLQRHKVTGFAIFERDNYVKLGEATLEHTSTHHCQVVFVGINKVCIMSRERIDFYQNDVEGVKLSSTAHPPSAASEYCSIICVGSYLWAGTNDGRVLVFREEKLVTTLNVADGLNPNPSGSSLSVLPVNYLYSTERHLFMCLDIFVIQLNNVAPSNIQLTTSKWFKVPSTGPIVWICLNENESSLFAASANGDLFECILNVDDPATGKKADEPSCRLITSWHTDPVVDLAFVANKNWIMSIDRSGKVIAANYATKKTVFSFTDTEISNWLSFCFHPFGNLLLCCSDTRLSVRLISNTELITVYHESRYDILQCAYSSSGHVIACLCKSTLSLISGLQFNELWNKSKMKNGDSAISFSKDDFHIYLTSANDVTSISASTGEQEWHWRQISVHVIDVAPGRRDSVFIASDDNCIREISKGEIVSTVSFKNIKISSIALVLSSNALMVATNSGNITCLSPDDVVNQSNAVSSSLSCNRISKIRSSPYCSFFATISGENDVAVWMIRRSEDGGTKGDTTFPDIINCRSDFVEKENETMSKKVRLLVEDVRNKEFILNSTITKNQVEVEQMNANFGKEISTLQKENQDLKQRITDLNQQSKTIANELNEKFEMKMIEKDDEHSDMMSMYHVKMDEMEHKYKKMLNEFDERRQNEIDEYENRIAEMTNKKQNLERAAHSEIKKLKKQLEQGRFEIRQLKEAKEVEIENLQSKSNAEMTSINEIMTIEKLDLQVEIGRLRDEMSLVLDTNEKLMGDLMNSRSDVDQLKAFIDEKEKSVKQKESDLQGLRDENKTLKATLHKVIAEGEQVRFILEEKMYEMQAEMAKMQNANEYIESEAKQLNENYALLWKRNEDNSRANDELNSKLKASQKLLRTQVLELSHKSKQVTNLKQQIVELKELSFLNQKEFKNKVAEFYTNLEKI